MKALSIRQPWAWLIIHAGKSIENRSWPTGFRGRALIHASKGMTHLEYEDACDFVYSQIAASIVVPLFDQLPRGGIVGEVEITDCVSVSCDWWFCGPFGFVLTNPKALPFQPCKGTTGFFVPQIGGTA